MYTPRAFNVADYAEMVEMARSSRLGILVSSGPSGFEISHVPFVITSADGAIRVECHLSRANSQVLSLRAASTVVVIFSGADAYISPSLYASKARHGRVVPTWNYSAVHAHGRSRLIDDGSWLHQHVTSLTSEHEAGRQDAWKVSDAPEEFITSQTKGIIGVEIHVDRLEGKKKLSQNRDDSDKLSLIAGMLSSNSENDRLMGKLIDGERKLPF